MPKHFSSFANLLQFSIKSSKNSEKNDVAQVTTICTAKQFNQIILFEPLTLTGFSSVVLDLEAV
jgi:hypothetical protein